MNKEFDSELFAKTLNSDVKDAFTKNGIDINEADIALLTLMAMPFAQGFKPDVSFQESKENEACPFTEDDIKKILENPNGESNWGGNTFWWLMPLMMFVLGGFLPFGKSDNDTRERMAFLDGKVEAYEKMIGG